MAIQRLLAIVCVLSLASSAWAGMEEAKSAYGRGMAKEKAKQYQDAIGEYEAALEAEPRYIYAHKQLGNCHYYLGNKAEALKHYDLYLAGVPTDATVKKFAEGLRGQEGAPEAGSGDSEEAAGKAKTNAIYTNPAALAMSTINLGYTRAFGAHNSLIVEGAFSSMSLGSASYTLVGGGLGWHFTSRQLAGA